MSAYPAYACMYSETNVKCYAREMENIRWLLGSEFMKSLFKPDLGVGRCKISRSTSKELSEQS